MAGAGRMLPAGPCAVRVYLKAEPVCADGVARGPAQDDTPKPTNRNVFLYNSPSATFFVSQYGGFGQDDITVSLKVARPRKTWLGPSRLRMHVPSRCRTLLFCMPCVCAVVRAYEGAVANSSPPGRQPSAAVHIAVVCGTDQQVTAVMLSGAAWSAQANALADKLIKAGENFVSGLFFTAGYDPPFRLTGAAACWLAVPVLTMHCPLKSWPLFCK